MRVPGLRLSHSAVVAWEAYLESSIPGLEGPMASHRIAIDGDETLQLDLGKFSIADNTLHRSTVGRSWKRLRMGLGFVDIRRHKGSMLWIH